MNLEKLELEKIKIPKSIRSKMVDDLWSYEKYAPFFINIAEVLDNGQVRLSYSLEFLPSDEEFEKANEKLEQQGVGVDGDAWAAAILNYLEKEQITFVSAIGNDSESETCVLYANNEGDFRLLLAAVSAFIRGLFVGNVIEKAQKSTIIIHRCWGDDAIGSIKSENIKTRPQIDYRISEYIWHFLNQNLLIPKNILQNGHLEIVLSMENLKEEDSDFLQSEYNTTEKQFFSLRQGKLVSIFCHCNEFNENISASDYASLIYDMYCNFLVGEFKKISKKECDVCKAKLDMEVINSFEFPATFESQKYMGDEYLE